MKSNKTITEEDGYVDDWEIRKHSDCHPSSVTRVYTEEELRELLSKKDEQFEKDINELREDCFALNLSKDDIVLINMYFEKLKVKYGEGKVSGNKEHGGVQMRTLSEVKEALSKIPDVELDGIWFGIGEGSEEDINLVATEGGMTGKDQIGFPEVFNKYPDLNKINKLVKNVIKAQNKMDAQEEGYEEFCEGIMQDGITDTLFDKKKE